MQSSLFYWSISGETPEVKQGRPAAMKIFAGHTHLTVVSKCQNKGQTGRSITSLHTPPTSIMPVRKADNYVCHSNYSKFDLRMPLVFTGSGGIRQVGRHATFVNDLAVSPTIYLFMRCHQAKHTFLAINVVPNDGCKVCLGVHSCHVMGSSGY